MSQLQEMKMEFWVPQYARNLHTLTSIFISNPIILANINDMLSKPCYTELKPTLPPLPTRKKKKGLQKHWKEMVTLLVSLNNVWGRHIEQKYLPQLSSRICEYIFRMLKASLWQLEKFGNIFYTSFHLEGFTNTPERLIPTGRADRGHVFHFLLLL